MRRLLSTLTSLSLLLTPTLGIAQPSGNSQVSEFNGADSGRQISAAGGSRAWHGGELPARRHPGGRGHSGGRRQRHRCGGRHRLRAGGNPSLLRQYRRRRLCHHPSRQRQGHLHQLPRKGAGRRQREHVSGRQGQCDPRPVTCMATRPSGVPGSVMGFQKMLDEYGTMKREQVMAAAIKLADHGLCAAGRRCAHLWFRRPNAFAKQPNVAAIFLNNGQPWKVGERLVQKQLAATLKEISAKGPDVFYKGDIAERVVAAPQGQWRPSHHAGFRRLSPSPKARRFTAPIAAITSFPRRRPLPAAPRCARSSISCPAIPWTRCRSIPPRAFI